MKIVESYDPDGVVFETLQYGDVFVYEGSYYIKCDDKELGGILSDDSQFAKYGLGANLANGELAWIAPKTKVPPVHCRLRIGGRLD